MALQRPKKEKKKNLKKPPHFKNYYKAIIITK